MDTACCRKFEGELANAKTFFVGRHNKQEKLDTVVGFPLEFEHVVQVWPWSASAITISTGKLAWFWVQPGHLEKQAETFRICLGGIYDYCPKSPKTSGGALNEIIHAKNTVVHMVDGRAYAKGIRVYLLSERALATSLMESSTVDENLKKGIQTRFVSLLYKKATLYNLEHANALHGIGALLIIARDWERYAPLIELKNGGFSILPAGSQHQTFRNRATWWLTHSGAQCTIYDTIPTPCFIHSLWTISSSVPARYAQPGKHHGTRSMPQVHEVWILHSAKVWLVLAWHMDSNGMVRCDRGKFDGYGRRTQRKTCRALSPCRIIQRSSYNIHTQVPMSQ